MNFIIRTIISNPSLWHSAVKVAIFRLMGRPEAILETHGIRMKANLDKGKGVWCSVGGLAYEPEMRDLLLLLKAGDTFVDVGANVGVFTLHGSRQVGPTGTVLSFEPTSETFTRLNENIQLNGFTNIVARNSAVADKTGEIEFAVCRSNNSNHIANVELTDEDRKTVKIMKVPLDTIDLVVSSLKLRGAFNFPLIC